MLLAGHHTESWTSTEGDSSGMRLRVRGENAAEQLIHLRFGKTTIGSSPRCDVRIQQSGVRPVHLLIVREPDGLSVRSWASDSLLNGMPFQEAPFKPGDCLTFASVELEIEDRTNAHAGCHESDAPTAEVVESKVEPVERKTVSPPAFEITPIVEPDFEGDRALLPPVTMDERENDLGTVGENAARGAHGTRDRVRQTRDEYRQLADRVEGLECLMEAALFVPEDLPDKIAENEQRSPAAAVVSEAVPSTEATDQLARKTAALECEIENLKSLLAAAERTIAEWELRREALDQERARWEVDRTEWETHRSDVKARLAESEIRLTEYVSRIEKLEQELAAVGRKSEGSDESWTESKVRDGQSRTENERVSAVEVWPVTEHRGFGQPSGDAWPKALPQSSLSDHQSPFPDNKPPSLSSFPPPTTPKVSGAEFDWSATRNSQGSEWQANSLGDDPSVVAATVSQSAISTGSPWASWQSEVGQSRNSDVMPADTPAAAENAWQSHASSHTAPASARESNSARSELTPVGSSSVPAGEFNSPASARRGATRVGRRLRALCRILDLESGGSFAGANRGKGSLERLLGRRSQGVAR